MPTPVTTAAQELAVALQDVVRAPSPAAFGVYVHVPYCAARCGYCDFNTYTAAELGPGVRQDTYAADAIAELRAAARVVGRRQVDTVFFGGGTPTLLPARDLVALLAAIDEEFGLAPGCEVTTEANPDSVDATYFDELAAGGFTRVSLGMQSTAPYVLRVLERTHDPRRAIDAVADAHAAGIPRVNLDLIYGTPGETDLQWRESLAAALAAGADHISAYALTVEQGTALGAAVAAGRVPAPDADTAAARYEAADDVLSAAGLPWYEISNWARPGHECRHNLGYWRGGDWWGIGPGAHSHLAGVRWHNVKHPRTYTAALRAEGLPVAGVEALRADERRLERLMLAVRMSEGLPLAECDAAAADQVVADGLAERRGERLVLTRRGRLLADRVTLALLG